LVHLQWVFAKKWDHFWGDAPRSSPEGGLVFWGKSSRPLTSFILLKIYIRSTKWGVGFVNDKKNFEILPKGKSDVAVGCSKRW
jgi:hypothetical protein